MHKAEAEACWESCRYSGAQRLRAASKANRPDLLVEGEECLLGAQEGGREEGSGEK